VHELSIALSIIDAAEEEVARQGGGSVFAVHLRLGPLSGVAKEALLFSYNLACEGTSLENSTLLIEDIPISIWCSQCEKECAPVSLQQLHCVQCGMPATKLVRGSELEVSALELQA
jgi:hydrogenase nickel incorporation protein HypA/HybF